MATNDRRDTATRILDVAERLVQVRGFNGFSYADIASELAVSKPSLHYHFAGKAELGEALIARYAARFLEALDAIDATAGGAREKLEAYTVLYANVLRSSRMCLCGMLAAEYRTLPEPMQQAVVRFFDANEAWLERVLEHGRREGALRLSAPLREEARAIIGGLEGAMLIARPYDDVARFQASAERILAGIT
jgi:TetR/AcrR family transcriptional regulator, transcriptional repressor for nem operon